MNENLYSLKQKNTFIIENSNRDIFMLVVNAIKSYGN